MNFISWITSAEVGSVASIVGACLSLLSFAFTARKAYASRDAAERAEVAATEARKTAWLLDTVQELTMALAELAEAKRLQRERSWNALPEHYATLRRRLVGIRSGDVALTADQAEQVRRAIMFCSESEEAIDRSLSEDQPIVKIAALNRRASDHETDLQGLLIEIRKRAGAS